MFRKYAGAIAESVSGMIKSNPHEDYKRIAFNELREPGSTRPAAIRILRALLNTYFVEGNKSTNTRTHSEIANECVRILDETPSSGKAMEAVIAKLNTITCIKEGGHFATLLNIYFSAFQEYLPDCNAVVTKAALNGTTWHQLRQEIMHNWVKIFMQDYLQGKESCHEKLLEVAKILPEESFLAYAEFLCNELQTKRTANGLHHGWVYMALGEVVPHLPAEKKTALINTLTAELNEQEITCIGTGYALAHLDAHMSPKEYKKTADQLYLYAIQNLNTLLPLFDKNQNGTTRLYVKHLFKGLNRFAQQYTPEQKQGIINILLQNKKTSYALRDGLLLLQNWLPSKTMKTDFISSIPRSGEITDEQKMDICTTFSDWVKDVSLNQGAWSPFYEMKKKLLDASMDQSAYLSRHDHPELNAHLLKALMTSTNPSSLQERRDIIKNLARLINSNDYRFSDEAPCNKIYQTITLLSDWVTEDKLRASMAKKLYEISNGDSTITSRIYAAQAALQFSSSLDPDQVFQLRDIIISGLDSPHAARIARDILTEYANAKSTPAEELPALMSCLMAKHPYDARLLLCEINQVHESAIQAASNKDSRPAVGM